MSKRLRILLIAGHGAGDPGACSSYGVEADENRRVLEGITGYLSNYDTSVDIYPINRNCYADIGNGCLQVNFANYDYVFEIHFNSSSNAEANGVEIYVTPMESGITVEQGIVKKVEALGYYNRGVKREDFRVIRTAKNAGVSSALLETCFISNKNDMDKYNSNINSVCKSISEGIAEGFGISKTGNSNVTLPPTTSTPNTVNYYVRTPEGKQLGAFNVLDNGKRMAQDNKSIVYDAKGNVVVSYVVTSNKKYVNLKSHMTRWRVYKESDPTVVGRETGFLNPSLGKDGGLSYTVLKEWGNDIYSINTSSFGRVKIYCPNDNDGSVTKRALYEFIN